jgi:glutamate-ammonia-ligase adenylyltransferase
MTRFDSVPGPILDLPTPDLLASDVTRLIQGMAWVREESPSVPPEALRLACGCSTFVADFFGREPEAARSLWRSGELDRQCVQGEIERRVRAWVGEPATQEELMTALRRLRRREMVRIAWRDLTGTAGLAETLDDLSALARGCLGAALDWCHEALCERYGVPRDAAGEAQGLVVLGMGKLGGRELNFSSDIDLIFAYPEVGETDGGKSLDNSEFFLRLGRRLIKVLNETTVDGFVYRVDMRLRPFGEAGALAAAFDAMEAYYQHHGRDWERYALVKADIVAGDADAGCDLLRRLTPFVYRRYLDFGAFESLRKMKALIDDEMRYKGLENNVKLGPGGIREIEFIGQVFQLLRGGRDPALRERGITTVLRRLGQRSLLPDDAVDRLLAAYEFLRRMENRLQMVADRQTHLVPEEPAARARLAWSMGYPSWGDFHTDWQHHRRNVQAQFEQIFAAPQNGSATGDGRGDDASRLRALWCGGLEGGEAQNLLSRIGFAEPEAAVNLLRQLRESQVYRVSSEIARQRLDGLVPLLLEATGRAVRPDRVLKRLVPLIEGIARRSVYVALLVENPVALLQLVTLSDASPWISEYLSRHPILLDELLDPRALYSPPDREGLVVRLGEELGQIDVGDREQALDRLRHFKHAEVLKVAAADVMEMLPLMRVSDQLTWIAEVILEKAVSLCRRELEIRYGQPTCVVGGQRRVAGFAVIGYGKLGGIELGYGSDLDIVFLHDSEGERQLTDGDRQLDNTVYFARLGQRVINMLTVLTPAGVLYEVDARLRPSGASGMLVSGLSAFSDYQENRAWTWEHQALVRARPVAGDGGIAGVFNRIREQVLRKARDPEGLRLDLVSMRRRMWGEHGTRDDEAFDLKRDPGGITDIEFMVQYLVLAHAAERAELTQWTDNIRILDSLSECDLLPDRDARDLQDIFRLYRDKVHHQSLQDRDAIVDARPYRQERERVRGLWQSLIGDDGAAKESDS